MRQFPHLVCLSRELFFSFFFRACSISPRFRAKLFGRQFHSKWVKVWKWKYDMSRYMLIHRSKKTSEKNGNSPFQRSIDAIQEAQTYRVFRSKCMRSLAGSQVHVQVPSDGEQGRQKCASNQIYRRDYFTQMLSNRGPSDIKRRDTNRSRRSSVSLFVISAKKGIKRIFPTKLEINATH